MLSEANLHIDDDIKLVWLLKSLLCNSKYVVCNIQN